MRTSKHSFGTVQGPLKHVSVFEFRSDNASWVDSLINSMGCRKDGIHWCCSGLQYKPETSLVFGFDPAGRPAMLPASD